MQPTILFLAVYISIGVGFSLSMQLGQETMETPLVKTSVLWRGVFFWPLMYLKAKESLQAFKGRMHLTIDSGAKLEMPEWPPRDWDRELALEWVDDIRATKAHEIEGIKHEIEDINKLHSAVELSTEGSWRDIFKSQVQELNAEQAKRNASKVEADA